MILALMVHNIRSECMEINILKGLLLDESSFYTSKYGYAGIPIPISSGETSGKKRDNNFSKLASMNILDYRVEVMAPDYNGDMIPTDISFLFQRGSSKKDYNNLLIQEQEILTIQIFKLEKQNILF